MIKVVPFQDRYAQDFKSINQEWLEEYIGMEESDLQVLNHPRALIIQKGGSILMAFQGEEAIGTICLEKADNRTMITKLGVKKSHRGQGVGKLLCLSILDKAKKQGLSEVWLETSQKLQAAIQLYKKLGFQDMNAENRSSRCDMLMMLVLEPPIN